MFVCVVVCVQWMYVHTVCVGIEIIFSSCLQRDIEQAKKGWELSHLQSLKEEEERLAEEEDSAIMLTYDRPEVANKVILRKNPSVDGWEIVSSTTITAANSQSLNKQHHQTNSQESCNGLHQPAGCLKSPISTSTNCNHQRSSSRSGRTVTFSDSSPSNDSSASTLQRRHSKRLATS